MWETAIYYTYIVITEAPMKDQKKKKYIYGSLIGISAIGVGILLVFLLYKLPEVGIAIDKLSQILAPITSGAVIAYLLRPICNGLNAKLQKWRPKWKEKTVDYIAITLSMIIGLLIVYALIAILVPQLYYSIVSIWDTLPGKAANFVAYLEETFSEAEGIIHFFGQSSEAIYETIDSWIETTVLPNLSSIVSGVGMSVWKVLVFLKNLLIGLIVAVYLLANRKTFKRQAGMLLRSILKPKWAKAVSDEMGYVDRLFGGFISGKILDSAIIGVLCYIGCVIFKFPNALLVAAIVGVTNIIPFFGPFIGAIPSALLIFLEDPIKGLWFVLFVFLLQQLDGNVIGPKILGDRTGLSSFWVLFAIVLFGGIWGLAGMIIGVPLMAVIYDLIKKYVYSQLAKNEASGELEDPEADPDLAE